ncbi:hypothetical protein F4781DRAFT_55256 [Annulohypoxylon bovei var. microspora]|nr:hypothetical protein F4781DRAFT_55256 [Annulohypoxylon bovei var. microspora]
MLVFSVAFHYCVLFALYWCAIGQYTDATYRFCRRPTRQPTFIERVPAVVEASNRAVRVLQGTRLGLRCYCFVFICVCANRNIVDT